MGVGAGQRRHVDDVPASALLHERDCFVTAIVNSENIRLENRPKVLGRHFLYGRKYSDACVINQDVETTKLRDRSFDQSLYLTMIANVADDPDCPCFFETYQVLNNFIYLTPFARPDANVNAFADQSLRNSPAYTLTSASYNRDFAIEIHCSLCERPATNSSSSLSTARLRLSD